VQSLEAAAAPKASTREGSAEAPKVAVKKFPSGFTVDMSKVDAIAAETREVIAVLAKVMEEPEAEPEPAAPAEQPASEARVIEIPAWATGLDPRYVGLIVKTIARESWSKTEFSALVAEFHLMPGAAIDAINEWSEAALGDYLLTGDDPVLVELALVGAARAA